jgi:hypothetical protein
MVPAVPVAVIPVVIRVIRLMSPHLPLIGAEEETEAVQEAVLGELEILPAAVQRGVLAI